jgi:hypothetical protein
MIPSQTALEKSLPLFEPQCLRNCTFNVLILKVEGRKIILLNQGIQLFACSQLKGFIPVSCVTRRICPSKTNENPKDWQS